MVLEPSQSTDRKSALLQQLWNSQRGSPDSESWSRSGFFLPDGPNRLGIMTPSYSLIVPNNQPSSNAINDLPRLQAMYDGSPCTRLVARFAGEVDAGGRRTAKILEEVAEPNTTIRTHPSYIKAENNYSPIPYYPTIFANWDETTVKKRVHDCCFSHFLNLFKFG